MKKRLTFLIFVVLAILVIATPVLANDSGVRDGPGHRYRVRQAFTLTGTITALGTDSITVLVRNGNQTVRPHFGQELVVRVTENTLYRQWTPDGCVPISFGDLQVGDITSIAGTVSEGVFTARRVTVDVPCCTR